MEQAHWLFKHLEGILKSVGVALGALTSLVKEVQFLHDLLHNDGVLKDVWSLFC